MPKKAVKLLMDPLGVPESDLLLAMLVQERHLEKWRQGLGTALAIPDGYISTSTHVKLGRVASRVQERPQQRVGSQQPRRTELVG